MRTGHFEDCSFMRLPYVEGGLMSHHEDNNIVIIGVILLTQLITVSSNEG